MANLPLLALMLMSIWCVHVFALPRYVVDERFNDGVVKTTTLAGVGDVVYRAEPGGRGTVGILLSCTATYVFCVWTSLHPNIVPGKRFSRLWYKVVLMMISILVPQAVMACAVGEMWQAWKLKKEWEKVVDDLQRLDENQGTDPEKTLKRLRAKLPMKAAFFVVMGGFLINRSSVTAWSAEEEGESPQMKKIKDKGKMLKKAGSKARKQKKSKEKSEERQTSGAGEQESQEKKNSKYGPTEWWKEDYVHKLVLKNKTARSGYRGYSEDIHERNYRASVHECDDVIITYPHGGTNDQSNAIKESQNARPTLCRSPDSCRVMWILRKCDESCGAPACRAARGAAPEAAREAAATDNCKEIEAADVPTATDPCMNKAADPKKAPDDLESLEPGSYSTILTPNGLIHCLKNGQIDHNSFHNTDMDDKGSSTIIAKVLALAQALWLVVQSFARWQNEPKLPLTLLEVHVLLQVACAGFTYICWWPKPLDVIEPIVVTLHDRPDEKGVRPPPFNDEEAILKLYNKSKNSRDEHAEPLHFLTTKRSHRPALSVLFKAFLDIITQISPAKQQSPTQETPKLKKVGRDLLRMAPMFVAAFLVAAVGALHFVALGVNFSSGTEQDLWTAACAGLVGVPFLVLPILCYTKYHEALFSKIWKFPYLNRNILLYTFEGTNEICAERRDRWTEGKEGPWRSVVGVILLTFHYILFVICVISLIAGLVSSFYLTVEAYYAMRSPPAGSFTTPRWSDWLPHI